MTFFGLAEPTAANACAFLPFGTVPLTVASPFMTVTVTPVMFAFRRAASMALWSWMSSGDGFGGSGAGGGGPGAFCCVGGGASGFFSLEEQPLDSTNPTATTSPSVAVASPEWRRVSMGSAGSWGSDEVKRAHASMAVRLCLAPGRGREGREWYEERGAQSSWVCCMEATQVGTKNSSKSAPFAFPTLTSSRGASER